MYSFMCNSCRGSVVVIAGKNSDWLVAG